jgi:hypothetical protein
MRSSARAVCGSRPDGFVLVGVLMFILVLTILGLTLFSLSSLESQFFYRANDDVRARYAAMSGIERAKVVLSATSSLAAARDVSGAPIDSLVSTVAKQGTDYDTADSTSLVDWTSGTPVWIRALAVVNGERALVEAKFTPNDKQDNYRRMFTLSGPIPHLDVYDWITDPNPPHAMVHVGLYTILNGGLSQFSTDSTFKGKAKVGPAPYSLGDTVSVPDVPGFIAQHWSQPGVTQVYGNPKDVYTLDASGQPDQIGFFETSFFWGDDKIPPAAWSLNVDGGNPGHVGVSPKDTCLITVHGTCIWMFDNGVRFHRSLRIVGNDATQDALIIVAKPGTAIAGDAGQGIVFKAGVVATNASVVLVTNSGVGFQHWVNLTENSTVPYLSVYAAGSDVVGPGLGHLMTLTHLPNAVQDQPNGLIDRLSQKGYLPNSTTGTTGDFTLIAGSWREIKSTDGY